MSTLGSRLQTGLTVFSACVALGAVISVYPPTVWAYDPPKFRSYPYVPPNTATQPPDRNRVPDELKIEIEPDPPKLEIAPVEPTIQPQIRGQRSR